MARIQRKDAEWIRLMQDCKSSAYPDSEWCRINSIPPNTFYLKLSLLREKACTDDLSKPVIRDNQAVVEVKLYEEQSIPLNELTFKRSFSSFKCQ